MRNIMRAVIGLVGLFNITIGFGFLATPAALAAKFFLSPLGSQGLATLRADFPGFFITGGAFALLGALRGDAGPLRVPMLLLAIAISGRFVSLAVDGRGPEAIQPMVAEAVMIALLLVASRVFARPAR